MRVFWYGVLNAEVTKKFHITLRAVRLELDHD